MKETEFENKLNESMRLMELVIQQHSGGHSDILRQIGSLERTLTAFRVEVDPMLKAFRESQNYRMVWTEAGITIKKTASWILVVTAALASVWAIFKYVIKASMR